MGQQIEFNVDNAITDVQYGFGQHAAVLPLDNVILTPSVSSNFPSYCFIDECSRSEVL